MIPTGNWLNKFSYEKYDVQLSVTKSDQTHLGAIM